MNNLQESQQSARCKTAKLAFFLFISIVIGMGTLLSVTGILRRAELQTIDRLFEARSWVTWNAVSLKRLNPFVLWQYHEAHEIPRRWWAWDYTLSWLIEPNQLKASQKIVIFNHLLEDEPPVEALVQNPWMEPLTSYPVSRKTLADAIEFLAQSGARLIVLDNDFPQYSKDDERLARAIHNCSTGALTGRQVPILIAGTIVHRTANSAIQINFAPPAPGLLRALQRLEPTTDLIEKYVGNVNMVMDEDQIVRRCATARPGLEPLDVPSIAVKALQTISQRVPTKIPEVMDIDFVGPPNGDTYPIRPFTYLLDPDRRAALCGGKNGTKDVSVRDAIVILGDGVTDVFATPYTNSGVNLRSGSEVIANAIDTISRQSWPHRINSWQSFIYLILTAGIGATLWTWRRAIYGTASDGGGLVLRILVDLGCYLLTVFLCVIAACIAFAYAGVILPIILPVTSLTMGALATSLWERECETAYWLREQLRQTAQNLALEHEKHEVEMRAQSAEAQARQIAYSEQIRKDFVRKINHDLKAPVTVMSWTLAKWKQEGINSRSSADRLERMVRTCDRLVGLLHELASNYEHPEGNDSGKQADPTETCELGRLLSDCISMAQTLAEQRGSQLRLNMPQRVLWVAGNSLEIGRVFDNLIRNALIHNPSGTEVQVEVRSQAHRHQVYVIDNGVGIQKEKLRSIFDRTVDEAGTEHIGLSITRGFVEKSGGTINVTSTVGCGTTFTVALPSFNLSAGGDSCEDVNLFGVEKAGPAESGKGIVRMNNALQAAANVLIERHMVDGSLAIQDMK